MASSAHIELKSHLLFDEIKNGFSMKPTIMFMISTFPALRIIINDAI